jgi:hypothetical protein
VFVSPGTTLPDTNSLCSVSSSAVTPQSAGCIPGDRFGDYFSGTVYFISSFPASLLAPEARTGLAPASLSNVKRKKEQKLGDSCHGSEFVFVSGWLSIAVWCPLNPAENSGSREASIVSQSLIFKSTKPSLRT